MVNTLHESDVVSSNITNMTFSSAPEDYFAQLYSDSILKWITFSCFLLSLVIEIFIAISFIWYEKNSSNRYRTVINKMYSSVAWYGLLYISFVFMGDGIRLIHGPFSTTFCHFQMFIRNALINCIFLSMDAVIILRYIFIFRLKNIAIIDDDFLAIFLNFSVVFISSGAAVVRAYSVGELPINYFTCSGIDPNHGKGIGYHLSNANKYNTLQIIWVLSVLLHLAILLRIQFYKWKAPKNEESLQLGMIDRPQPEQPHLSQDNTSSASTKRLAADATQAIMDLGTPVLFIIAFVGLVIMTYLAEQLEPNLLNTYENRWLVLGQLSGTFVLLIIITPTVFYRNPAFRLAIWRRLKELLQLND